MKRFLILLFVLLCTSPQWAMAQDTTAVLTVQVNIIADSLSGEQDIALDVNLLHSEIMGLIIKVGTTEGGSDIVDEEIDFEMLELQAVQSFEHDGNVIHIGVGLHPLTPIFVQIIARKTNGTLADPVNAL
jgi:hypothetical protein